jgi:PKD repeat protein
MIMMTPPLAVGLEARLPDTHPGIHAVKPGGPLARVDGMLFKVYLEFTDHLRTAPGTSFRSRNSFLRISRGRILVDARATGDAEVLLSNLNRLGLRKGSSFGKIVSGWLPIGVIRQAGGLDSLRALSASIPMTNTGDVTSQGDVAQRSDIARSLGYSGAGVKVGVLSDSYNHQGGAAGDVLSYDLPTGVQVLDDSANCGEELSPQLCTDEGRAMLQIVHDVAYDADLAFHTAFNGFAGFANGILDLADAGADVIVDDVMYLGEPMFMDGAIAQAVDKVTDMGIAYFSAAGNSARDSYESEFFESDEEFFLDFGWPIGLVSGGFMHDFDPSPSSEDTQQAHTIPAGQCAIFSVQWDSRFGSAAAGNGTPNDLDIWLLESPDPTDPNKKPLIVAQDARENSGPNGSGEPVEAMIFCNDGLLVPQEPDVFNLVITLWDGDAPGLMKSVLFGSTSIDEYDTDSGTLYGHANSAGAEAVGAAYYQETPEFGTFPPQLESFSSAGGTPILFASNGTRLATPELRMKPEIVAPDGVNTTFFYPGSDRDGDGDPDFSGTSAAAPHAAAAAALMLEAKAGATPTQVKAALENTAIDMDVAGFDYDTGYGLIQADEAIAEILASGPGNTTPVANFSFSITNLEVQFTDQSSDLENNITDWSWDFGDGGTATTPNPSHSYSSAGTYTVILTVMDDGGAVDSVSKDVTVSDGSGDNTAPIASFSYRCDGKLCGFSDLSTDPDTGDSITAWAWSFGDGETDTAQNPSHLYASQGTYTVVLTVTDENSTTGTVSASFRVKNRGIVNGTVDGGGDSGGGSAFCDAHPDHKKCT